MMAVSEFLVLCGGLLGFKANYDTNMKQFRAQVMEEIRKQSTQNNVENESES